MSFGGKVSKTRFGRFNNGETVFGLDKKKVANGLDRFSQVASFAKEVVPAGGLAIGVAGAAAKIASRKLSSNFEKE